MDIQSDNKKMKARKKKMMLMTPWKMWLGGYE